MKCSLFVIVPLLLSACVLPPQMDNEAGSSASASITSSDASSSAGSGTTVIVPQTSSGILTVGESDAPVTILLFTHHSCEYCKEFQRELMPRIMEEYVRTEKVRVEIVPVQLAKYADSAAQAQLLACAMEQGKGMMLHDALFDGTAAAVQKKPELGLDAAALTTCLASEKIEMLLQAQALMAASFDVTLVPTYFIGETRYQGLPEWPDLRGQIEENMNN